MLLFRLGRCLIPFVTLLACGDHGVRSAEPPDDIADAATDPATGYDFNGFDAAIDAFLAKQGLPGAGAVVVSRDAGVLHEASYGSYTNDRLYLVASSSKIISAGVLMRLADQGVVDLDAPLSTYVPADWGEGKADITLAQLLSGSSGMVGLDENPTYGPYLCMFTGADLSSCAKALYEADDAAERVPADTKFRYGGAAWQLAGGIAEVASKKSWDALLEETYREPCGTDSLGYANQFARAFLEGENGGWSYPSFAKGKVASLSKTQNPNIEGGSFLTTADYAKILLMHLRGGQCDNGRALSEQAVARMQKDRIGEVYEGSTDDDGRTGYGFGWFLVRDTPDVLLDPGAYGASAILDRARGVGVFLVIESDPMVGYQLRQAVQPALDALFAD